MMFLFLILMLSLQSTAVLSALPPDMYSICHGKGSVCEAYIQASCSIDPNNGTAFYACLCGTQLPLQQSCDECRYEYDKTTRTVDNWYWTSICSSKSIAVGTIPPDAVASFDAHTKTVVLAKSRTFSSAAMLSSYSVKATSTTGRPAVVITGAQYEPWTSTYGGAGGAFVPVETAPPSVEDSTGINGSGGRGRMASLTLAIVGVAVALLLP